MGNVSTVTSGNTNPTVTPQDLQLQQNELDISNATQSGTVANDITAQGLQSSLMTGQNLPGYLSGLPTGVSNSQSQNEAQMGLQGLATQFQSMGGLDSGSYAQAGANAYANTLNENAQFNVQNLGQLLNLASGVGYQNVGNAANNNSTANQMTLGLTGQNNYQSTNWNPFQQTTYGLI